MSEKKIFLISAGLGATQRGFEAHIKSLFKNINTYLNAKIFLLKGGGKSSESEIRIHNIKKKSFTASIIAYMFRTNPYTIHILSFFLSSLHILLIKKPNIVYLGEPSLYSLFYKWRKLSKQNFTLIFFTGGQSLPPKVGHKDYIHHVTPVLKEEAIKKNIPIKNQFFIPHFLTIPYNQIFISQEEKNNIKLRFNIPTEAKIILSVGAVDYSVKRMDYLIKEVSKLNRSYYLFILGEQELETNTIINLANKILPKNRFKITKISKEDLNIYYQIADIFALASLKEGFGLVYIEALYHGLPVIAHDYPVSRYVLSNHGYFANLEKENELTLQIEKIIDNLENDTSSQKKRSDFAYEKYSWSNLRKEYIRMFNIALNKLSANNQNYV